MLKRLRKKKFAKKVWIVLAMLILPAFVLWGSGSLMHSRQPANYAGKIGNKKISFLEYKDAWEAARNQAIIQFGDNFPEIQKYLDLESQAWERLILLVEAKKRGMKVNNQEVIDLVRSYPFFQRKGQFEQAIYSEMLRYVFRTPARIFEEQTRQNLVLSKLYEEVTQNVNLTEEEIKAAYRKENEEVSIDYIAAVYSHLAQEITVSSKEIEDYFAKNSHKFKEPPAFNVEYISLDSAGQDEEAIKDKIQKLSLHLNKNSFKQAAGDSDLTVKETGLFSQNDPIPGIGWSPQILSLISKLKVGEISPPLQMNEYYYIFRLKEKKEPYIPDFKTVKDKVKETSLRDKSQRMAEEKIEKCLKELKDVRASGKSVNLAKIAKKLGLESGSTELFKYGSYIEGIGASDYFWNAACALKERDFSEIISVPSGLYMIRIKSHLPIDEKKFSARKDAFTQKLSVQKRQEYFIKFVEDLKRKARVQDANLP